MQPNCIIFEVEITDLLFTTILLLIIMFCLAWLIYLQEQLDALLWDFGLTNHMFPLVSYLDYCKTMELKFGFTILVYYTWWLIVLLCMVIILNKLLTNQNFAIGFYIWINSASDTANENLVFQPILVYCHWAELNASNNNNDQVE